MFYRVIRKLAALGKNEPENTPPPPTPVAEPDNLIRQTPPILLRVSSIDDALDDTNVQFINYGWARGIDNILTRQIDSVMRQALDRPDGVWKNIRYSCQLQGDDDLVVTALQIEKHSIYTYQGPKILALFLPEDAVLRDDVYNLAPAVCRLTGGPSLEYLSLVKQIAMLLECRIISIETQPDGTSLTLFKPWSESFNLADLKRRQDECHSDETLDDSDESMADRKGS